MSCIEIIVNVFPVKIGEMNSIKKIVNVLLVDPKKGSIAVKIMVCLVSTINKLMPQKI